MGIAFREILHAKEIRLRRIMNEQETIQKEKKLWVAPIVMEQLNIVKKRVISKDRDWVCVIDGEEGSGKSVLAQQIAKYLDPNFSIDNIVFNSDAFLKIIKDPKTKKGTAIVLDEAFAAANSRASLSEVNRSMIGVATEMRQKNLFIIFCIPSFFDLDKYFALWRCRALFHVYFTNDEDRRYVIFSKDQKKMLYLFGKKFYSYAKPHSNFPPFSFSNFYTVDEQEYRLKKAEAFKKRTVSNQARTWLKQRNAYIRYMLINLGISSEDVANVPTNYGVTKVSQRHVQAVSQDPEKVNF